MPERIPRMENWGLMIISLGIQLMKKTSLKGLAMKKITRATQRLGPWMVMESKLTQQGEEEAAEEQKVAPQESSGPAGQGPYNPDLNQRVKELERLVRDPVAMAHGREAIHTTQTRLRQLLSHSKKAIR
jgi:hypothetical protein